MSAQTAAERFEAEMADGDTCRITRRGTAGRGYNSTTGDVTPPAPTEIYEGPCLISELTDRAQPVDVGGEAETRTRYQVSIPLAETAVLIGDEVAVLTSHDPALVDEVLAVIRVSHGTKVARRRITCELAAVAPRRAT
jgi:hypothetical protein